jgi:dienelactone hydrolase
MHWRNPTLFLVALTCTVASPAKGQEYGPPDRGQLGDEMIQGYLARETDKIHAAFLQDVKTAEDWEALRGRYQEEYFHMLGLWPMPPKTPLKATVSGSLPGDGYVVDMLHYQSRPGLYVTGNLYRPANARKGQRLPAVFYVCGHSSRGRNGNKTAFQSHGIWFARHGYVCLIVDSLQLGEIGAVHHGTYREGRWWWHARGYTPAGVECLNGIRGIDYLIGRKDVDPGRIAVTGISGGGAATFWIVAADQRVKVAVPVSGMADLPSYVTNRVINGHCDCMFLYNTFQWPWIRIAALVAPRAMLFTNSDQDRIFPMDANQRIINRLERVYSLYGASDFVDATVSIGGHAYRRDIRQAAYRFINLHLKDDPRVVTDSEVDLVTGGGDSRRHPIPPEKLRAFPEDSDIPEDELNTTIDRHFVPTAQVEPPQEGKFAAWKASLMGELRRISFRHFPERIPPARLLEQLTPEEARLETEPGIQVRLQSVSAFKPAKQISRVLLVVRNPESDAPVTGFLHRVHEVGDATYVCEPRGVGQTRWTRKDPPNYVARAHVLLGRTVDSGRVWDVAATARYLRGKYGAKLPVHLTGERGAGLLAAYAALWEPDVAGVILSRPPLTHMDAHAPPMLNVLRVCDVPDVLGMLAPRSVTTFGIARERLRRTSAIYGTAGSPEKLIIKMD